MNRRTRNLWTFLAIFTFLVISGHAYIYLRLISQEFVPLVGQRLATAFMLILAGIVVVQPFVPRKRKRKGFVVKKVAYFWLGASFVLVTSLGLADGLSILAVWFGITTVDVALYRSLAAVFFFVVLLGFGLMRALVLAPVRTVTIGLPRWPSQLNGFSIIQISDLHLSDNTQIRLPNAIVEKVNSLNADLVVLTGDMVDGPLEELKDLARSLGNLKSKHGVFFVTGNHDHYSGADEWCDYFSSLGITVLRNSRVELENGAFSLAGVDDYRGDWRVGSTCDLEEAVGGRSMKIPLVLLSHNPEVFENSSKLAIDLQLSGHTHGGQIWPFHAAVRAVTPYLSGLYKKGESTLYVSRGTGYWGPPIRLGAPAEIAKLILYQEN